MAGAKKSKHEHDVHRGQRVREGLTHMICVLRILNHERQMNCFKREDQLLKCVF